MQFRPIESIGATLAVNTALFIGAGHGAVPEIDLGTHHNINETDYVTSVGNWGVTDPTKPADNWQIVEDSTFTEDGQVRTDFRDTPYNDKSPLDNYVDETVDIGTRYPGDVRVDVTANASYEGTTAGSAEDKHRDQALADSTTQQIRARLPGVPITSRGVDALTPPMGAQWDAGDEYGIRVTVSLNEHGQPVYKTCERNATVTHVRTEDDTDMKLPYIVPIPVFLPGRRKPAKSGGKPAAAAIAGAPKDDVLEGEIMYPETTRPEDMSPRSRYILGLLATDPTRAPRTPRAPRAPRPARRGFSGDLNMPGWVPVVLMVGAAVGVAALGAKVYHDNSMSDGLCKDANSWSIGICPDDNKKDNNDHGNGGSQTPYYPPASVVCPDANKYVTHITSNNYDNGQPTGTTHYDQVDKP